MINLLPISKFMTVIAVTYGVFISLLLWLIPGNDINNIGMLFGGATVLNLLIFGMFIIGWKWLWAKFPILNRLLFPNINGEWDIKIHWTMGKKNGVALGVAHIKQDFLKISMEVDTDRSESETLCAKPARDTGSGRPILYYMYRVMPKQIDGNNNEVYDGSAILKLDQNSLNRLKGNYFTSKQTNGYFELSKKT